jgi:hypothetical protein
MDMKRVARPSNRAQTSAAPGHLGGDDQALSRLVEGNVDEPTRWAANDDLDLGAPAR